MNTALAADEQNANGIGKGNFGLLVEVKIINSYLNAHILTPPFQYSPNDGLACHRRRRSVLPPMSPGFAVAFSVWFFLAHILFFSTSPFPLGLVPPCTVAGPLNFIVGCT